MKTLLFKLFNAALLLALVLGFEMCKKGDVVPALINTSDAKSVSEAIILPSGSSKPEGSPPAPSTSAQAPKTVTPPVSDLPTINGSTETLNIPYTNLSGGIGGVYAQIEGAANYFNIPVRNSNPPASGTIQIQFILSQNFNTGSFTVVYCVYDGTGRVSNIQRVRFNVQRVAPAALGKGSFNFAGTQTDCDAICDIAKLQQLSTQGAFIDASAAFSQTGSGVFVYNVVGNGTFNLPDSEGSNFDESKQPWVIYLDSKTTTLYVSRSGKVIRNGGIITFNASVSEGFNNNARRQLSGSIRCQ